MNNLLRKVTKLLLGLSLAAGVGVAIGSKAAERADADTTANVTLSSGTFATDHITWSLNSAVTIQQLKGTSGTAVNSSYISAPRVYKGHVLSFVAESGYAIKSISITCNSTYYGNSMTAGTVYSNNTVTNNTTAVNRTWTSTSGGTHSISSVSNAGLPAIYIQNVASASNVQLRPSAISITYTTSSTYSVSYDAGDGSNITGMPSNETGLSNGSHNLSSAQPTRWGYTFGGWSATSGGTTPITSVTINNANVTVYAIWTADLSVTGAHSSVPFTVAQARSHIDGGANLAENYVSGKISQIDQFNNGSITYWISDDGTTTNQLEVYWGKGLSGADFTAISDIQTAADVVVCGTLTKYNSTYEFSSGSYQVSYSYTPPAVTHTVTFNSNGGSNSPASESVGDGLTFVFPSAGTKTDNLFRGWSNDGGSTFFQEGVTSGAVTTDLEYTAYWKTNGSDTTPYTVSEALAAITNNDGVKNAHVTGIITSDTISYSDSKYLTYYISADGTTSNKLEVYKGLGLNQESFTSASDLHSGDTVTVFGNLIDYNGTKEFAKDNYLVARTPVTTYTVTYDSNGGSGTMTDSNSPYATGSTVTILGNSFTKVGYTFDHWNTATDDSGTDYDAGDTFTISANTTLYAQWVQNQEQANNPPYSATFTDVETHGYTQDKEFTLNSKNWLASVSQVNGGVFYLGCNSTHAAKGILNDNSNFADVVTVLAANDSAYNSNKTTAHAYAMLFDHPYNGVKSVSFAWAGGNNAFQVYLFGDSGSGYTLLASENYSTSGADVSGSVSWTDPSTTTDFERFAIVARPGATNSTATSKTLRASSFSITAAAPVTYTISYDANGGTGTMADTTGASPEVAACSFTAPTGKEFSKWNTQANGEGTDYAVGATVSENITLYAIWVTEVADPSVYFTKITSTSQIGDGKYVIAYEGLIFDGSLTTLDAVKNTKSMNLTNLLTSYFTISDGDVVSASGKYIGRTADSNGFNQSDTDDFTNTVSIDGEENLVVTSSVGAILRYNKTSGQERFRFFKSSSASGQQAIQLYRVNFDKVFEDAITCNESAGTHTLNMDIVWKNDGTGKNLSLENLYNCLSTTDKANLSSSTLARYDYIVGKYFVAQHLTSYNDFMSRSPSAVGNNPLLLASVVGKNTNTIAIIVIISLVSVTAIGGYFFIKRRQEN